MYNQEKNNLDYINKITIEKMENHSFNMDNLNRIGDNDPSFNLVMLRKFMASISECSTGMQAGFNDKDWNKIKVVIHKSVPSYSMMGLDSTVSEMQAIKSKVEAGNYDIENDIALLQKKNKNLINEVGTFINELTNE